MCWCSTNYIFLQFSRMIWSPGSLLEMFILNCTFAKNADFCTLYAYRQCLTHVVYGCLTLYSILLEVKWSFVYLTQSALFNFFSFIYFTCFFLTRYVHWHHCCIHLQCLCCKVSVSCWGYFYTNACFLYVLIISMIKAALWFYYIWRHAKKWGIF